MKISKDYLQQKKNNNLHSPAHALADELSNKLGEPRNFGYYLKIAVTTDHNVLRHILGGILEGNSKNPGALFAYLVKKYNREKDVSYGYSIWLIPSEESFKVLTGMIQTLAQTFDSPVLKPHLTLISGLELENENDEIIKQLAESKTFSVTAKGITTGDEFFKSLYVALDKPKELMAIRRMARKALGIEKVSPFDPHICLLYANTPDEQKKSAIKELKLQSPPQITFDRIALVKTTGKTSEWKTKQLINLSSNNES